MKNIIGYIVAYFVGATVVRWYLTSEDGKGDLAEILEDAGYEYLATEIMGGQPLARKLAAYEQQERDARYEARKEGSVPQVMVMEADPELEALLDEFLWEDVEWSYNHCYYSTETRHIILNDGTIGMVVNYNKETGYVQLQVGFDYPDADYVDTTIKEVVGRV